MSGWAFGPAGRTAAAATVASLVASPVLAQANAVGVEAAIRNKVEIRSAQTKKVKPAVLRDRVFLADEVRTGDAGRLQILLLDRTIFTVGAKARVTIDRFVYDPAANSRAVGISVARGAFRFMSGRTLGKPAGPVTVHTPVATIGIRGTIFEGVVGEDARRIAEKEPAVGKVKADDDEASLIVLRGPGPRTQGDTIAGAIDVTAGDRNVTLDSPELAVYAPRRGAPLIGPFRISPAGLLALQSLLRTGPDGGGGGSHGTRNALLGVAGVAAAVAGIGLLGGKKKKPPSQPAPRGQQPRGKQ
ncbi:MAG: FecR family protein [Alphaproteobacteria bacterium]|nr:FecR family protein [Alphaproteobacteria bacterium]